jgi:hypothetical protein
MHILYVVAVPIVLVIVGMILNSIQISFDQPQSSSENDPGKKLEAERRAYRSLFDSQRSRSMKRQQRVGQYAWLVLLAFVGSLGWLYLDTVKATTVSKQIAAIQTLSVDGSKDRVLSLTLSDGGNVQYVIKSGTVEKTAGAPKDGFSKEAVQNWRLTSLGTALSMGASELPLGIALKIPN